MRVISKYKHISGRCNKRKIALERTSKYFNRTESGIRKILNEERNPENRNLIIAYFDLQYLKLQ